MAKTAYLNIEKIRYMFAELRFLFSMLKYKEVKTAVGSEFSSRSGSVSKHAVKNSIPINKRLIMPIKKANMRDTDSN